MAFFGHFFNICIYLVFMHFNSAAPLALLCALSVSVYAGAQMALPAGIPTGPTSEPTRPVSFDLASIDKTVDPCVDFYKFACGNWVKHNEIPDTKARWDRFDELAERNQYLLYLDLKNAAMTPKTPLQQKYGDYFAACMNDTLAQQLGAKAIAPDLAAIDAWSDKRTLATFDMAMQRAYGRGVLFGLSMVQDQKDSTRQILNTGQLILGLPDREYYLAEDDRSKAMRAAYLDHVTKMFALLGDTPEQAANEAAAVLRIETAFAAGEMARVEMRNPDNRYHVMTIAQVQELTPGFNWTTYLDGQGLGQVKTMNVGAPKFVKVADAVVASESMAALKSYFRWQVLHATATQLSKPFVDENFRFFGMVLNGQKEQSPRWQRCTRATDAALGEAVGQDWVKQNFPPDAKDSMEALVAALESALQQDIRSLDWMSEQTKSEAGAKLTQIRKKIGYPDHWKDYAALVVKRDDPVGNVERDLEFERERSLAKIGKPVDEKEWSMTPPTVNAYYSAPQNDINFPAGILQPPFYDEKADVAVNFGAIGAVIGHEMTHGFDDAGSKFDGKGNRRDWISKDDQAKFDEKTKCVADQYAGFEVAPGQKLNGRLTLGENTADNGGIRIAYQALMATLAKDDSDAESTRIDGYTPEQRFFIGFGQVWCEQSRESAARVSAKTDPHSTGEWRVRGTLENFDEFGKAFGCKVGQPMMPENSCRVW